MKGTDFSGYAGDNTPYKTAGTIEEVIKITRTWLCGVVQMLLWQPNKVDISKCHFLVNKTDEVFTDLGETEINNSEYEKLLGIKIDTKLDFNEYLNNQ